MTSNHSAKSGFPCGVVERVVVPIGRGWVTEIVVFPSGTAPDVEWLFPAKIPGQMADAAEGDELIAQVIEHEGGEVFGLLAGAVAEIGDALLGGALLGEDDILLFREEVGTS